MKVRDLPGWPPERFQKTDIRGDYTPPVRSLLVVEDVALVPGAVPQGDCYILLLLNDRSTGDRCSTRLKVGDTRMALRIVKTLTNCRGLALTLVDDVELAVQSGLTTKLKAR